MPLAACGGPLSPPLCVPVCQQANAYVPGGRFNVSTIPAPVSAAPKSPPMCSQSSSEDGPSCFAALITSWAVLPEGNAIGIISWVIWKDSWFWNNSVTTPEGNVAGTLWYWKFCTKIVAVGVIVPEPALDDFDEHAVIASASAAHTMAIRPTNRIRPFTRAPSPWRSADVRRR